MHPRCVKSKRPDLTATVCAWCDCPDVVRTVTSDLESQGYSVTRGVCRPCLDRWRADSLKGSILELAAT